uniref:Uncharacterized protein n=1 Tax=Arundo donax TaxID=35708 RepID=A0A0A9CAA9_ARUDO
MSSSVVRSRMLRLLSVETSISIFFATAPPLLCT